MGGLEVKPNIGYWDSKKKKWNAVEVPYGRARAYYKERLYLYDHKTHIVDMSTGALLSDILSPAGVYFADLIVTPAGLLGVDRLFPLYGGGQPVEKCCFKVYRLEDEDEKPRWIELSDIGDLMIFIGSNNCFCLSASDFDGFKGNCIYFLRSNNKTDHHSRCYVVRYDLGENISEVVACTRSCGDWIVPSLC
ncbi:putative F-box protein At2g16290 [Carex rostrata]